MGMTETAILKTAAHELTHFIQANSAQYEALKSFVVNKLTHEEGVSFEDLVADKQRREPGLEYDEAVDEVVADACEMMLGDSTVVEQLAKENRSLAEKIRDWLREWVENLKIALEGLQADRTESRTMMQYARELQEIWDNALMDAARNNRGTAQETAPAESRQQARAGTGESIKPGEKTLKGKRNDDKMDAVNTSLKEDLENGKARKENRGAFLRRTVEEGYQVFEGKSAAYGYRSVRWESAGENARQIQKELTELGIDAEIIDGDILWNLDGISSARRVPQATTVEKKKILVNAAASLAPRNTAGHEAFHLWYGLSARKAFEDVVIDNLRFSSKEFLGYQAAISEAYLGKEADLSDEAQYTKLVEEIIAYISGDIHEGVNDDLLRPIFHDYDAVKAAWVKLCKDRVENKVQSSMRDSAGRELTEAQQAYFKDSKVRDADGNLLVMYHQTDGTFTVFDTKHKGAGAGDDETPFGIFLKRTSRNIGVRGEKQMELYADIRNPLRVRDRTELVSKLRELSVDYARLKDESAQIDKEYGAKFEEAKNTFRDFLIQWRKDNPDAPPRAAYDADGFDAAFDAEDNVVKEWTRAKDELALRAKTAITQALRDNGYDGVILEAEGQPQRGVPFDGR